MRKNNKGFTLVELLVVVAVMIIVVGVTGDIVISIVRSYNKTQITNEIEQNANFVMTKLERELRYASSVLSVNDNGGENLTFTRRLPSGSFETIKYSINDNGTISREIVGVDLFPVILINHSFPDGVEVIPVVSKFTNETVAGGPTVIKINLSFSQIGYQAVQFTQDIDLETTVVVRGSY